MIVRAIVIMEVDDLELPSRCTTKNTRDAENTKRSQPTQRVTRRADQHVRVSPRLSLNDRNLRGLVREKNYNLIGRSYELYL